MWRNDYGQTISNPIIAVTEHNCPVKTMKLEHILNLSLYQDFELETEAPLYGRKGKTDNKWQVSLDDVKLNIERSNLVTVLVVTVEGQFLGTE